MQSKRKTLLLWLVGIGLALLAVSTLSSPLSYKSSNTRLFTNVKSLHDLRWNQLTRQGWDISCGAAALSTLLTYNNNRPFSEMAITLSILKNSDPSLVRQRGGFSLFDLKRFVNAIGFQGLGYGEMTIEDLDTFSSPAIIPLKMKGFDHFVIFRQRLGNRILLGDPAIGNTSFSSEKFLKMWKSRIAFYVVTNDEKKQLTNSGKLSKAKVLSAELMDAAIPDPNYTPRILSRIPVIPITRRIRLVKP